MFRNFELNEVSVSDADFSERQQAVKQYLKDFPVDRLVHNFRVQAGIVSTAQPLGGWEAPDSGLRGHFVGHYLSAASKFVMAGTEKTLENKISEIVDALAECASPNGYLNALPESVFDVLEREENRGCWAPYYVLHKTLSGLTDAYRATGNEKAIRLAVNLAYYVKGRFDRLSFWKTDSILRCVRTNPVNEFGGMGDALYTLYELTADEKILHLAEIFDRDYFLKNLQAGKDVLENLHANTHLPMIISALHRFCITGEEDFKTAALNFYRCLSGRTFANGSSSGPAPDCVTGEVSEKAEHWGKYGDLSGSLSGGECESCCAQNTEKILEYLFCITGNAEILDHIERLKYNSVLNSASSLTGLSQYHQPLGVGCRKKYSERFDSFWCCTGTGIEAMAEIQKNIWFKSDDGILLNLFVSSAVDWREKGVRILQRTKYPDELTTELQILTDVPKRFKIRLRENRIGAVKINGQAVNCSAGDGFAVIEREFQNGDSVHIALRAQLHRENLPGSRNRFAVLYGNILLAERGDAAFVGKITPENIGQALTRTRTEKLEFRTENAGQPRTFVPVWRIGDEAYSVYLSDDELRQGKFAPAEDGSGAYSQKE